jgi:hypothetical protein
MFRQLKRIGVFVLLLGLCFLNLFSVYVLLTSKTVLEGYTPRGLYNGALSIALFVCVLGLAIILYLRKRGEAFEFLAVLLVLTIFFWVYFHASSQGTYQFLDYRQGSYYDEITAELASGVLGVTNNGHPFGADWSFYNGVNYLYFPPFPSILQIFIRGVFSVWTTFDELTLVFSILNLASFYLLMREVDTHLHVSGGRTWIRLLFLLVYGLGPLYFMASRYFVYETSIIFGSTFLSLSTWTFLRYFYKAKANIAEKTGSLVFTSLLFSFAFLSRYNLALCIIPMIFLVLWKELRSIGSFDRKLVPVLGLLFVFLLPILTAGLASAGYNMTRFGSPLEFGQTYQHTGNPEDTERLINHQSISIEYFMRNLYQVTLLIPRISSSQPYLNYSAPSWLVGEFPKLTTLEWSGSIFFASPLLLFVFAALPCFRKSEFRGTTVLLVLLAFTSAVVSLSFQGYARRYLQDFYPFITLLAFLGFTRSWNFLVKLKPNVRIPVGALLVAVTVWTALVAFDLVVQFAFRSDLSRALRAYNEPSTFVYLSIVLPNAFNRWGLRHEKVKPMIVPR